MAGTAHDVLRAIDAIYRRWLDGEISQEDALFEIGDLLARLPRDADDKIMPFPRDPGSR
jgi:hypothetical protein